MDNSADRSPPLRQPIGRFHTWWRGDPLLDLPSLPGLSISRVSDPHLATGLDGLTGVEVHRRMVEGHHLWLAQIREAPVGWGWSATQTFSVGELGITRSLPLGNRYLWDFFTVPVRRGQAIYPRLLQAIVSRETSAHRFWLGHDLQNEASRRGIARAGFQEVGLLTRQPDGSFVIVPSASADRVSAAAALFGYPVADAQNAPGSLT